MENDPSRASLGRWARARLQARRTWALGLLPLLLAVACEAGTAARPRTVLSRVPPEEIIVRTTSFAFHMGARVDERWPEKAEETRASLGQALSVLLVEEDTTVPILARQLGVTWPDDPLDFDVVLRAGGRGDGCDAKVPRLLDVGEAAPRVFFACVLERSFGRLREESALHRGLTGGRADAEPVYACIVAYAVGAVMVAQASDRDEARAIENRLGDACTKGALAWVSREWIKRVRGGESAEAFGARAAREIER
jgi:hypothetical protein